MNLKGRKANSKKDTKGRSSRLCTRVRAIWDDEKSSRRQDLLGGAAILFEKREFSDISIVDICQQTGLAKGTFYLYFSSKEEIFLALADTKFKTWADEALAVLKELESKGGKLSTVEVATAFAQTFREYDDLLWLLSMLHAIIECNVEPEKIVPFKRTLAEVQAQQTSLWLKLFPSLTEQNCAELMIFISSAIVGIWTITHPPLAAQKALALAGLKVTTVSFDLALTWQLKVFLDGLLARASKT